MRSCSWSGGSRPPMAAVMGSPVIRMRKNTMVTRMRMVGKISRKRTRMYWPSPPPDCFFLDGRRASASLGGASIKVVIGTWIRGDREPAFPSVLAGDGRKAGRRCGVPPLGRQSPMGVECLLGQDAKAGLEGRIKRLLDTLDVLPCHQQLRALEQRQRREVLGNSRLDVTNQLLPFSLVRCGELLLHEVRDSGVLVVVLQEVARDEERREVVVRIRVVREPAQLVHGVGVSGPGLGVGHPFGGLQVDREQARLLQLFLDHGVLVTGGLAVVVRVVLE